MVISLADINLSLGDNLILTDINLLLDASELTAIVGPNGAGKSCLVKCLCGELAPNSGQVTLFQRKIEQWSSAELACRFAVLPQQSLLSFPFLVRDVVALGRYPHSSGKASDSRIVREVLQKLDIAALSGRTYPELSGGEKQRVQLARVLAQIWESGIENDPKSIEEKLLVLDEPTSALDLEHQHTLMKLLVTLCAESTSVITVMHDFNLAAHYADRIIVMNEGRIIDNGSPAQVFTPDLFLNIFKTDVDVFPHPRTGRPIITHA